jgi:cell pole-organizing protein PopZ
MTQSAKAQEPSMEEILASIRRIIADDDSKPAAAPKPATPPRVAAPPPAPPPPPRPAPSPREFGPIPPAPAMTSGNGAAHHVDDEILDLTESMTAPAPAPAANFRTIDGQPDVIFTDSEPARTPPMDNEFANIVEEARRQTAQAQSAPPPPPPTPAQLLSSNTVSAVDSAFNTLAHTVLVQNARTLEDLVREMLRPMLKSWLDDNLPGLVERIVRSEIERVSRGRV